MATAQNSGPGYQQHPEHTITIQPANVRCQVLLNGQVVASSDQCLRLDEGRYPAVYYLPLADVDQHLLSRSDTSTYCPFKGTATYWHLTTAEPGGETNDTASSKTKVEDALWGYPEPYDEVSQLADYVAFYPNKVDSIEILTQD